MLVERQNERVFDPNALERLDVSPPMPEQNGGSGDVLGAAFRQENVIGSFMSQEALPSGDVDLSFNAWDEIQGTAYEPHWQRFAAEAWNRPRSEALMRQIDRETEDRRTLDSAGGWGILASLGAGLFSPENLLPGGTIYRGVRTGAAVAKTGLSTASAAAIAAGAAEVGLQSTQVTRTGMESAFAVGGSAILGGVLGAGLARAFSKQDFSRYAGQLSEELNTPAGPDAMLANETALRDHVQVAQAADVGAAAAQVSDIEDLGIDPAARFAAAPVANLNPALRTATSPSRVVRETGAGLLENGFYLKMNAEGRTIGPGVESLVKEYELGAVARSMRETDALFSEYRKGGGEIRDRSLFMEAVGRAMRRGDEGSDPAISSAAKVWRERVFDPLKEEAIKANLLPADVSVETALSYFTRVYNAPRLIAEEGRFKGIVRGWLDGQIRNLERAASTDAKGANKAPDFVSAADREAYIEDIADQVFNTLTGRLNDGDVPLNVTMRSKNARGPLEERTFNIPDELIEDFLESNVEAVGRRYARIMAADVELTRRFGSANMSDTIKAVRDEYNALRTAVEADDALTAAQRENKLKALDKREKNDIVDVEALRDLIRGTYKRRENSTNYARVARVAGTINYLRALGGVTISSLTDVARHVMVHGLDGVMRDGIVPLISNIKAAGLSIEEARIAGAVTERTLNTRLATWADLTDPYSFSSPFEKFMENTASGFSKLNGLVYWNDFQKSFASIITQNRILRNAVDGAKMSKRDRNYMAYLGIDDDVAAKIAEQFQKHGSIEKGGVRVAGTDLWDSDPAAQWAKRVYRAALNKDIDTTIITKGIGDVPLFANTPTGRLFLQFKGFALASHQRALMRGLSEDKAGFVSGMLLASTVGMMIYALKSFESNRVEDISDNPGRWIAEGVDRSGMLALAFEANNTIEKSLGIGAYGALAALFPNADQDGKASRYMVRSTAAALAGPTADFIDTAVRGVSAIRDAGTGEGLTEGDINAFRRLAPGASLPGIRSFIEYIGIPAAVEALN